MRISVSIPAIMLLKIVMRMLLEALPVSEGNVAGGVVHEVVFPERGSPGVGGFRQENVEKERTNKWK